MEPRMIAWSPPTTYAAAIFGNLKTAIDRALDDLAVARCGVVASAADLNALPPEGRLNRIYRVAATNKLASFDGADWYYADGTLV